MSILFIRVSLKDHLNRRKYYSLIVIAMLNKQINVTKLYHHSELQRLNFVIFICEVERHVVKC
jgi:hypothetical protein